MQGSHVTRLYMRMLLHLRHETRRRYCRSPGCEVLQGSTLKMEGAGVTDTVTPVYETLRRHILETSLLQNLSQ